MRNSLLCSVLVIGILGCGSGKTKSQSTTSAPPATQQAGEQTQQAGGQTCPMMQMAGANVVTSDTSDGVAIAFTTTGDVAALRANVRRMADMYNGMAGMHQGDHMHGGTGEATPGAMGSGAQQGGMREMQMVPSRASVENLPGGARLVLVPTDPAQLAALRAQAREHAEMMKNGECPMMGTRPQPTDEHAQHHPPGT